MTAMPRIDVASWRESRDPTVSFGLDPAAEIKAVTDEVARKIAAERRRLDDMTADLRLQDDRRHDLQRQDDIRRLDDRRHDDLRLADQKRIQDKQDQEFAEQERQRLAMPVYGAGSALRDIAGGLAAPLRLAGMASGLSTGLSGDLMGAVAEGAAPVVGMGARMVARRAAMALEPVDAALLGDLAPRPF